MCIAKKLIFIVYSKRSNNHENKNETIKIKIKILFNISQLYSIPQFLRANF